MFREERLASSLYNINSFTLCHIYIKVLVLVTGLAKIERMCMSSHNVMQE